MPRIIAACALAALLTPALLFSQYGYGRRVPGSYGTANPGGYSGPAVTFQGNLKMLGKKELRIEVASEEQGITFRVSRKTHFLKDGKEIKLADVKLGTVVAVDAIRDPDQKFSAMNVVVSPPQPKPAEP